MDSSMDLLQLPAEFLRPLTAVEKQEDCACWAKRKIDQMCRRFAAPKFNLLGFFGGKLHPKCMKKSGFRNFDNFAHLAFRCALFGMIE